MKIYKIAVSPTVHNRRLRENGDIKAWRDYAHRFFDRLWRNPKYGLTRDEAYQTLAQYMGLSSSDCHMSVFNVEQCKKAVEISRYILEKLDEINSDIKKEIPWKSTKIAQFKIASKSQEDYETERIEDFLNTRDLQYSEILAEYYDKKRKMKSMMSWDVIPFARLKKIWQDYAKYGVVRDERGMQAITEKMLHILARLNATTDLAGHGSIEDSEIEELTGQKMPDPKNFEFYFKFLETKYGTPVSDYGLPKLNAIAKELMVESDATKQLLLVDRMLNVVHQRGDLAALFIEGGSNSLNILCGKI